ncbi:hypothetical protein RHMOL_Rhmol08G0216000 [Rhododendron molle]|uniref:Uncharacterized protein n=1 Tax=Rhododendron molle TaxID=49168 RepID=A0ACC0MR61_RHOML|nr:hypothetical protein RHMOL_Rhmol08G0216000 [Rhododendron molle]
MGKEPFTTNPAANEILSGDHAWGKYGDVRVPIMCLFLLHHPLHCLCGSSMICLTEPNSCPKQARALVSWSASLLREPICQTKKVLASKSQTKQINPQTIDTESGRVKQSICRNPPLNFENTSTQPVSEFEKPKRNGCKVPSYPADSIQENPQNELEKKQTEGEESVTDSSEKIKNRGIATVSELPDIETTLEPLVVNEEPELLRDDETAVETQPLDSSGKDESMAVSNGELSSREDLTVDEIKESAQKAAPLAKHEHSENGIQNRPMLPSYMAATESAKAKLRAQGSPRLGQDVEKHSLPRRHSLPASTNSKVGSASPRAYRDQHK